MSSILEALERAEKERNPVEKSSFIDSNLSNPGVLQRHWVWIIAGVLLINLFIWVWVMMSPGQSTDDEASSAATQAVKQKQLATADTVVSILEQPKAGVERKSDPPLVVEALVTKKSVDSAVSAPATRMPKPTRPTQPAPPPQAEVVEAPVPLQPPGGPVTDSGAEQAELPPAPEPAIVAAAAPAAITATPLGLPASSAGDGLKQTAVEDQAQQIPTLWESPANLQEKLSDLKINIHVYNDEAAQRFVIINMRKYREGDRLEPSGMQLERITREGIVINHGNGRIRM